MTSYPDSQMQNLLQKARKYSTTQQQGRFSPERDNNLTEGTDKFDTYRIVPIQVEQSGYNNYSIKDQVTDHIKDQSNRMFSNSPRRTSMLENEVVNRRLSEAGVNRRPSASLVLTPDTSTFIVGDRVYVDGINPGRIQYIGETKFGPGDDWAGVFLDAPLGKNDGSVGNCRYFTCEPRHGVFSKLHRLTREPIEGAREALDQMKKYGYEVMDSPTCGKHRRDSGGSGGRGSRRESGNFDDYGRRSLERTSTSPYNRSYTPDNVEKLYNNRRDSMNRYSPDSHSSGGSCGRKPSGGSGTGGGVRRTDLPPDPITGQIPIQIHRNNVPNNRKASLTVPIHVNGNRKAPPGRSPLASPRNSRSNLGYDVRIDKDPEITTLTAEARRLSMGGSARRTDLLSDDKRRDSVSPVPRRDSTNGGRPIAPMFSRKTSESLGLGNRNSRSRSGSESEMQGSRKSSGGSVNGNINYDSRKSSNDLSAAELQQRRLSEAGVRRSSTSEQVLNEDTSGLMVGMTVWVDGVKRGRIAYIGDVHFAKGEMAGVHLDQPLGKNNGTVGGKLYFQTEPKRGIFSRLYRLTREPLLIESSEE